MIHESLLEQLISALEERSHGDCPVQFWLRDDDAIEPSAALDHLLLLSRKFNVPITLAVIPALSSRSLAQRLDKAPLVTVAVHGWSHTNHAADAEKKQELGLHRSIETITSELERGFAHLAELHEQRFVPLLVPPWNRISSDVIDCLHSVGFRGLSTFADNDAASIAVVNTHVDLIDWKGTRGGRDHDSLAAEILQCVKNGLNPIGILTHHLDHDDRAWDFLEQLFCVTANHPACEWVSVDALLPATSP
ncbi:MAG: polysaccharide deacetylase family protein [Granulosicoccus sp.]